MILCSMFLPHPNSHACPADPLVTLFGGFAIITRRYRTSSKATHAIRICVRPVFGLSHLHAGGLQACLDMSSAFDLVPRSGLLEALHEAGVPEAPARLMLHWLERSTYRIRVEKFEAEVPSSRGVKQGCPASPLLYAAFMSLIARKLDSKLGQGWVANRLTAFADDLHVSSLIKSYFGLDTIHRQAPYLGAVTSCLNFTELSLQTRLLKCKAAQTRLRSVLQGPPGPFPWAARPPVEDHGPALRPMYGLGACVLSGPQLTRLRQVLLRQLRAISRTPAHITHESDHALLSRLGILTPQGACAPA